MLSSMKIDVQPIGSDANWMFVVSGAGETLQGTGCIGDELKETRP